MMNLFSYKKFLLDVCACGILDWDVVAKLLRIDVFFGRANNSMRLDYDKDFKI